MRLGASAHLTVENPVSTSQGSTTVIDIDPNSSGLPGIEQLRIIVGAVMTVGLILSVLVSCGAAIICGAAVTLVNFFWGVGQAV